MSKAESQMTPPYLYPELANIPTHKLVNELIYRISKEPDILKICPARFQDLARAVYYGKH